MINYGRQDVHQDDIDAVVSYARISSPFEGENPLHFVIDELSARFSDPALDIRSLSGTLDIDGDSIALNLSRFELPGSKTELHGVLSWSEGPLLLALDLDADRLAVDDARPFVGRLPWGLEGSGRVSIHSLDPDHIRVGLERLRLDEPDGPGGVSGRLTITVHKGQGWILRDTELAFESLNLDYLRPMVDTIPFAGRVSGTLVVSGPSDSLDTQLGLWFRDSLVAGGPETHIRGAGTLALDGGIRFNGFRIDSSDVALSTVHRLLPNVDLQGQLALTGSLVGPWRDVLFDGTIRHRDGGLPESVARGWVRLDSRTDTVGVWAELNLDSLNFAGIHRSYPGVPERGMFGGELSLSGYADSLRFQTTVGGSPGRIVAEGDLTLLPQTRGVRHLVTSFENLDVQRLHFSAPHTELYGRMSGDVVLDSALGLGGALTFAIDTSFVAESPFDSLTGVMRFADHTVQLDEFEVWGPSLYAFADGGLGLDAAHSDTLAFEAVVDSLGTIESLLRDRFSAFDRDSLLTRIAGALRADATISGSLDAFVASGMLEVPSANSSGGTVEGLGLRVTWPTAANGRMTIDATLDSLAVGRYSYSDLALDLDGHRNDATWEAHVRIGLDGSWFARGGIRVEPDATSIPIDSMGLLLPTHRWFLEPGAVITLREDGYDFDSVAVVSEDGGARLELRGRVPRGGSPGMLTGEMIGLPLADLWGLVQLDPAAVGGVVGGNVLLSGSATDPTWRVSLQWNDGRFGSIQIPLILDVTASYADRRLTGNGAGWRLVEQVLALDFDLPVDLALEGADERRLPGQLAINATGEGIDLSLVALLTPAVTDAVGRLDLDVGITGSWREPQLRGTAAIAQGGANVIGLGVTYSDVDAEFALSGDTIRIDKLGIQSGDGHAEFEGFVRLEELTRPILDMAIVANDFRLIDVPQVLALTTSGEFELKGPLYGVTLTGAGTIAEGDLYFADLVEKQIVNLEDTLYASLLDADFVRAEGLAQGFENRLLDSLRIDSLVLQMGSNVRLLSNEADIQLTGQMILGKVADRYRLDGTLATPRGTYQLPLGRGWGVAELVVREFDVTGGQVQYFGTPDLNADVNIDGRYHVRTTRGQDIVVFVNVGGTLYSPDITLTSDVRPELPQDEIISYLLFNAPSVEAMGGAEVAYLGSTILGAFSNQIVNPLISGLGLPLDYLRIRPPTQGLSGTEIALGWQLSEKTFVTLSPRICHQQERGLTSNFAASLEYRFSPNWHFAASSDPVNACMLTGGGAHLNRSQFGLDMFWEKRY
ncbi:MAG: translocation/assembly module TamB [Gemmatimonadetes bacterium]|nr:translocation/assembly module TamB [Gemmatimonadota bacterium]